MVSATEERRSLFTAVYQVNNPNQSYLVNHNQTLLTQRTNEKSRGRNKCGKTLADRVTVTFGFALDWANKRFEPDR